MTAPNMATITASLERSLQNCSLNHPQRSSSSSSNDSCSNINMSAGIGRARFVGGRGSSTSDSTTDTDNHTLELNSEIRLPYYWEQCLDLNTGEVSYINWRTGMKSQEDPRTNPEMNMNVGGLLICSEDGSYESEEGSSTEEAAPSTSSSTTRGEQYWQLDNNSPLLPQPQQVVLVVAGCQNCFMYFMLPKQVQDCPKCFGQLLHFDPSQFASP
ncbi:hypothetical protein ACH5RR_035426 [Cinchona calisaya]|uniref:WW domain-containing protein n=1 Tax=Cinchona calisaya TaxID=153742 RepID=A0ABD2Y3H6_9GENT